MGEADQREVGQRVGLDVVADLFEVFVGGDEVLFARGIDAIEAGGDGWRAGDAQVDFSRAGGPHHANDFAACSPANDGVIDEDDAFAFQQGARGIELHPDAKVADSLRRLDERPAHIVVADEAEVERNPGFSRITQRGSHARVRHRHHEICRNRRLAGELAPHLFPRGLHPSPEHLGVRPRKVDVLEDARGRGDRPLGKVPACHPHLLKP